jgi:Na+/melibiose symporter-like transporter
MNGHKLSLKEKVGFGLGDTATNFVYQTLQYFIIFFYTDIFGISVVTAGTLFLVARIFDAISDPVMGVIADRTNTRWGKFRPWIAWTAIPFGVIAVLTFTTPDLSPQGKIIYAYVTYISLMLIFTMSNVPYNALSGVMTSNSLERTSLSSWRMGLAMLAAFVVQVFSIPLVDYFGRGNESVVEARIENEQLIITENGTGVAKIILEATDDHQNSVTETFYVKVDKAGFNTPFVANTIDDLYLEEGFSTYMVDIGSLFHDLDGDGLSYRIRNTRNSVISVVQENDRLLISERGIGRSIVNITADDGKGGSAAFSLGINVNSLGNNPPKLIEEFADLELTEGFDRKSINLSDLFVDTDGDEINFLATSNNGGVASAVARRGELQIIEKGLGKSTIVIYANDGRGGLTQESFSISIISTESNPPVVASGVGTRTFPEGFGSYTIDIGEVFLDFDNHQLSYEVTVIKESKGYQLTMISFSVFAIIFFFITFFTTRERVQPPKGQKISVLADLKDLMRNKPWMILFTMKFLMYIMTNIRNLTTIYYFAYVVGNKGMISIYLLVGLIALVASLSTAKFLAKLIGKRNVYMYSLILTGLTMVPFYFIDPQNIWMIIILNAMMQAFIAPTLPLTYAMLADTADYSEWKNGRRSTGMVFSAATFSFKAGGGLGGWIAGLVLAAFGYVANVEQTPDAIYGILLLMSIIPAILCFIAAIATRFYPITEAMTVQMQQELDERRRLEDFPDKS